MPINELTVPAITTASGQSVNSLIGKAIRLTNALNG